MVYNLADNPEFDNAEKCSKTLTTDVPKLCTSLNEIMVEIPDLVAKLEQFDPSDTDDNTPTKILEFEHLSDDMLKLAARVRTAVCTIHLEKLNEEMMYNHQVEEDVL